jgi:hypothetical protein
MLLAAFWASALLACYVEEGGPTLWDLMTMGPAEQREMQARLRETYPWAAATWRLRKHALGALFLGVALYAIGG